ncbi:hypothetical protein GCM10027193_24380 [Arenimonas aestuarii]
MFDKFVWNKFGRRSRPRSEAQGPSPRMGLAILDPQPKNREGSRKGALFVFRFGEKVSALVRRSPDYPSGPARR